jgi:hypothetical protein
MNGGRPAAAAEKGMSSSDPAASSALAKLSMEDWGRRCARCLYREKRAKAPATDAMTEPKKRRLSGDSASC